MEYVELDLQLHFVARSHEPPGRQLTGVHSPKLTWSLKKGPVKRMLDHSGLPVRFHVCLAECMEEGLRVVPVGLRLAAWRSVSTALLGMRSPTRLENRHTLGKDRNQHPFSEPCEDPKNSTSNSGLQVDSRALLGVSIFWILLWAIDLEGFSCLGWS